MVSLLSLHMWFDRPVAADVCLLLLRVCYSHYTMVKMNHEMMTLTWMHLTGLFTLTPTKLGVRRPDRPHRGGFPKVPL